MALKLKLADDGHAVLQDGKPVYIDDEKNTETAIDVPGTVATIARLNGEAKTHREGKEAAEKALKAFDGITDPAAAIKALATVGNLDAKKLIDAGEVEKMKAELTKGLTDQIATEKKRADDLESGWNGDKIGRIFDGSAFIKEKVAVPADMMQDKFGKAFKVEGGKVTAYDASGGKIYSRANPGELASPDEALEILVNGYTGKDYILKGNSNGGSGARQGGGQTSSKTWNAAQFEAASQVDRAAFFKDGGKVSD